MESVQAERLFESPGGRTPPAGSVGGAGGGAAQGAEAPLAARVRPAALAEFAGQGHLLHAGSALRTAIERREPHSMILHGPPGSGKTTLARMFAACPGWAFEERSAVQTGLAEVRALQREARARARAGEHTVLFLDEIHRFNKAQQDALLPAVEDGLLTLIGATTENPAFEVNGALLSRLRVYTLEALGEPDLEVLVRRALSVAHPPLLPLEDSALTLLAQGAGGDARVALSALELACASARARGEGSVSAAAAAEALGRRTTRYDRAGDGHYGYVSAWIKATRGSDPDASLYYLAVMLEGGEDARFIARRMVILASEDIGNADPAALSLAVAAAAAVEHVGLPEARYALAQAAIYLSLAPKSNSAGVALEAAQREVREHGAAAVPPWLLPGAQRAMSARAGGAGSAAAGEPYDYPHAHPAHASPQELLPEGLSASRFYRPDDAEATMRERLLAWRAARRRG
ncbi:MAG: replication-associated recombination protein A [Acidobacteriota bacterium]|nr:replication-associated recombination protein A [Acidobacteriota bacterium]